MRIAFNGYDGVRPERWMSEGVGPGRAGVRGSALYRGTLAVVLALHVASVAGFGRSPGTQAAATLPTPPKHVVVYAEPGKFCGFPANAGVWSWGREILVGFALAGYQEKDRDHSTDRNAPKEGALARSLDGGLSWALEKPKGLWNDTEPVPFTGRLDFTQPNFALRCAGSGFQFSNDRGKTWSAFYALPKVGQSRLLARTDYVVNGRDDCFIFSAASKRDGKGGRPFCMRTRDGGRNIEFLSWIGPEARIFAIMPSTVRTSGTQLVSAIRRKDSDVGFIEVYVSNDDGRSWTLLSKAAATGKRNGNPPAMVRLKDGRLVLTYGYRSEPIGIRAKISRDGGRTWGQEIHLRDDGRTWDLGYPRTVTLPDDTIVTMYYFTTEQRKEEHIAATIWRAP